MRDVAHQLMISITGLEVVVPDISTGTTIGVSCGILVVLFMLQPLGIHKLASAFAPIVIIWLVFNACFGIYVSKLFSAMPCDHY